MIIFSFGARNRIYSECGKKGWAASAVRPFCASLKCFIGLLFYGVPVGRVKVSSWPNLSCAWIQLLATAFTVSTSAPSTQM